MSKLTAERLRELLHYSPETGVFTWKKRRGGSAKPGNVAGRLNDNGYWRIRVDGPEYFGHRLAWLYVHGVWPDAEIDHIDRNRANNRIDNLRQATRWENCQNTPPRPTGTSRYRGVSFEARRSLWRAQIARRGRNAFLGYFDTEEEAFAAYVAAVKMLHTHNPLVEMEGLL